MTAQLLDKGTKQRRATAIADSLEQLGSSFYASSGHDSIEVGASSLSFYKNQLLRDFSEILLQPIFYRREMRDVKERNISHLIKTVDNPSEAIGMALQSYLYGDEHPYSRRVLGQKQGIQSITRNDLIKFYKKHYTPKNSMLAVVGDFDEKIVSQLESHLGSWKGPEVPPLVYPDIPDISGVQIRLIDHPDVKQTQIRLAHKGVRRSNPDYLKLRLANTIFGNGLGSRLVGEIRVKRGLTYSIRSGFDARKDLGPFVISTSTRHDKVGEAIRETLNTIKNFVAGGVTNEELVTAKSIIKGRFPRTLETAESLAYNLLHLRFHNVSDTYLTNFHKNIDLISQPDINKAITEYFSSENIKVVIYGPKDQIVKQVRPLGAVENLSYKEFL